MSCFMDIHNLSIHSTNEEHLSSKCEAPVSKFAQTFMSSLPVSLRRYISWGVDTRQ